jgi:hypothetical protein
MHFMSLYLEFLVQFIDSIGLDSNCRLYCRLSFINGPWRERFDGCYLIMLALEVKLSRLEVCDHIFDVDNVAFDGFYTSWDLLRLRSFPEQE